MSPEHEAELPRSALLAPGFGDIPPDISEDVLAFVAEGPTQVWNRPALTRGQRSMITVGLLTAFRADRQLRGHVEMAIVNNGLTRAEVCEVVLHTAMYAGFPAALNGFAIAAEVFERLDTETQIP
jgi:4-carboxymuconolactone decarboxylase